jgi:lipid-A-disaccharide synthase
MVILYRGSKLMWIEGQIRRIRPPHIGMPNIIAGRRIVPEFIQDEASPEVLAREALRLLRDPAARAECKAALREVRAKLGEEGASERTARMALEVAGLPPIS